MGGVRIIKVQNVTADVISFDFTFHLQMIGHYHNKTDGLLCKLTVPCERPGWKKKTGTISRTHGCTILPSGTRVNFDVLFSCSQFVFEFILWN